ncbi:MAG TPA: cytochrome c [Prolixibacteraceae bacterium]|nr:cytochrome c [Prolixibacteraceae bacterium]
MKIKFNHLIFSILLGGLILSCHSNTEKKKVEAVSSEQLATEMSENLPVQPAKKEHPGKAVYTQYCLVCHQADGSGVPNMHPPLGPGSWVGKDPKELVALMMKGLSGKIEVNGEVYKSYMPSHAKLTNNEIANVLSYIRSSFGNDFEPVTADFVKKVKSGR